MEDQHTSACPVLPGMEKEKTSLDAAVTGLLKFCRSWRKVLPILLVVSAVFIYSSIFMHTNLPGALARTSYYASTWDDSFPECPYLITKYREDEHLYPRMVYLTEDLVVSGDDVYVIENCTAILEGYIKVTDEAQLVIRDAELFNVKRGISGGELVPFPANIYLEDRASCIIENATLRGYYCLLFTLNNDTKASIKSSSIQGTLISFGDSKLQITNSTVELFQVAQRTQAVVRDSQVGLLYYREEEPMSGNYTSLRFEEAKFDGVKIESWNTVYEAITLPIRDCQDFSHIGGILWGSDWSLRELYPESEVLDFTSHGSEIKRFRFQLFNCVASFEEVPELFGLYSWDTEFFMRGCRLCGIDMHSGIGVMEETVSTIVAVHGDARPIFTNDNIYNLAFINFTETAEFENTRVEILFIDGEMTGSIEGSVTFGGEALNAFMLEGDVTITYTLVAQTPEHVIPDAKVELFSPDDELMWSGQTDENGTVSFQIIYSQADIDTEYLLQSIVGDNVCRSTVDITVLENPIVHEFENLPVQSTLFETAVRVASVVVILALLALKKISSI